MEHHTILHMLGLLILGGSTMWLVENKLPLDEQPKRLVSIAIGIVTLTAMGMTAGVI